MIMDLLKALNILNKHRSRGSIMPKERRDGRSSSFDQSRASPYPCRSKNTDKNKPKSQLLQVGDEKDWELARCPVCMEHAHNAVLLICSSHEKGCRPYMTDTSYRHSHCLDQFLKSPANESTDQQEEVSATIASHHRESQASYPERVQSKLVCPLCRGQISTWVVREPARQFMNSKTRSCSLETCDFVGNYSELRKHARGEHPYVRPMEVDPTRQLDWARSERQTALQDLVSALDARDEFSENSVLDAPDLSWMDASVSIEYPEDELEGKSGSPVGNFESSTTYVVEIDIRNNRRSRSSLGRRLR